MNNNLLRIIALTVLLSACSLHEDPESTGNTAATVPPVAVESPADEPAEWRDRTVGSTNAAEGSTARDKTASKSAPVAASPSAGRAPLTERRSLSSGVAQDSASYAPPRSVCCFPAYAPEDRENYQHFSANPVHLVSEDPVSTFSIDVDTGSYANVRRLLNAGSLPPEDAVRVEELINYFDYAYPVPEARDRPFSVTTTLAPAPWNRDKVLMQVGLKGFEIPAEQRASANLVFLIDVSGSMQDANKLPLLKNAFRLLTRQMRTNDRVSVVVYAGAAGTVLPPTSGANQAKISAALDRLAAGGSTNGAGGIRLAYQLARQGFVKGGINRIVLATDGDFNVGTTDFDALIDIVERERDGGVSLTTLGFGTGNYNDELMERLADAGNGNYAYIDTLNEGRKVLVDQLSGTLQTIAKDVKIQVEFNSAAVAEYRLIGYENRLLRREDFNNDRIDAGDIGAGHTVTALYELTLTGSPARLIDPLRYGAAPRSETSTATVNNRRSAELANVRLRFKAPDGKRSRLIEQAVRRAEIKDFAELPRARAEDLRFAAAVAAFGQKLRGGEYLGAFDYGDIARLAASGRGVDASGYRGEFVSLIKLADSLAVAAAGPRNGPSSGPMDRLEAFDEPQVRR